MKTVKYDTTYKKEASRLELFIRWFWMIPVAIVMIFLSIVFFFAAMLQFWHVLILGKRNKMCFEWSKKFVAYITNVNSYFYLTDERCPLMPED